MIGSSGPGLGVNRGLARGLCITAIALGFGLTSLRYRMGTTDDVGPGLFPLVVSCLLLAVGISTIVRAKLTETATLDFQVRNVSVIIGSLIVFAVLSNYVNMATGIVAMVFCASLAMRRFSIWRNLGIAAGLLTMAYIFQRFLGLQLNLF